MQGCYVFLTNTLHSEATYVSPFSVEASPALIPLATPMTDRIPGPHAELSGSRKREFECAHSVDSIMCAAQSGLNEPAVDTHEPSKPPRGCSSGANRYSLSTVACERSGHVCISILRRSISFAASAASDHTPTPNPRTVRRITKRPQKRVRWALWLAQRSPV